MAQEYLSVTALTKYLKRKFDVDPYLERVYLTGEISNFRLRANAHQYFSLKDDGAKISGVMFKNAFQQLKFQPKEGMKVLVVGRVSLFEASGNYQIYIEHMEPDGVGALYQALAELREKLQKEGLFQLPKKALVKYPKRIAVITSPSGAVIRDILTTVRRRYPIVEVVVFPTLVQGNKAAANIVENIEKVEAAGNFDTMILARGGGSIEDLWPFNEEVVARKIAATTIPVISSVGHETDVTIADLVADVRAATPTAAAELAVPVLTDELLKIRDKETRLMQAFRFQLNKDTQRLAHFTDSYVFKQPNRLYEGYNLKLDMYMNQLKQGLLQKIQVEKDKAVVLNGRLWQSSPEKKLEGYRPMVHYQVSQLQVVMKHLMEDRKQKLLKNVEQLDILSPLKVMSRGFTYGTKAGEVVKSVKEISPQDSMVLHFVDGKADVTIEKIEAEET